MEGYGNDNPGAKSQGIKHLMPSMRNKKTGKSAHPT
ncbi:Maff2 family mobile element protein [Anaerobutyricum hallii]